MLILDSALGDRAIAGESPAVEGGFRVVDRRSGGLDSRVRHGARLGKPLAASPSSRPLNAGRSRAGSLCPLGLLNWAHLFCRGGPALDLRAGEHRQIADEEETNRHSFQNGSFASRTRRGQHAVSLRARDAHETPRGYPVNTSRVAAGRASRLAPHAVVARVSGERVVSTHRGPSSDARDGSPQISRRL